MRSSRAVRLLLALTLAGLAQGATRAAAQAPDTLTAQEREAGWRLLFDGRSTTGWRGYGTERPPAGWVVQDGALVRAARSGDIMTVERFGDFELELEWKISAGGNSGVFYRVAEIETPRRTRLHGLEMQVLDNAGHRDGRVPETSAGSAYGVYAPVHDATRPVGEWNHVRIVARGAHVEHWMNGIKVVEYELGSDDWKARVARSRFASWPAYAQARTGHISLQDHGDWVAYRRIRIRPLR